MNSLYRIIPFNVRHGNCGGSLVQFQAGDSEVNALPFEIGKVLVMSDIRPDDVRGMHAHYETEEILVVLTGGCTVEMDDGCGRRESVRLGVSECRSEGVVKPGGDTHTQQLPYSDTKAALLLYPHVWRVMRNFEPGTILMVVANIKYDEADYIRDRTEFERISRGWKSLGGSSLCQVLNAGAAGGNGSCGVKSIVRALCRKASECVRNARPALCRTARRKDLSSRGRLF